MRSKNGKRLQMASPHCPVCHVRTCRDDEAFGCPKCLKRYSFQIVDYVVGYPVWKFLPVSDEKQHK